MLTQIVENKQCVEMANSKYEYVKSYEVEDEIFSPNLIVVRIDGRDFRRCLPLPDL